MHSGKRDTPKVEIVNQDWDIVNIALEKLVDQKIMDLRGGFKNEDWIPKPNMDEDDGPSVEEMY